MSQSNSSSTPTRHSHHILIIDDSARLRFALADLIVAACLATGKPYRVFHCDKDGQFVQSQESLNPSILSAPPSAGVPSSDPNRLDEFAVYTAPSPKHALFVINSPLFTKLTIICDVMMPADTEVGLVGMLDALARRSLPVNLVFASSDAQNRYVVAKLVETGQAYFMIKAGGTWETLSQALVHRTDSFQFKIITVNDFAGIGGATSYAMGMQAGPVGTFNENSSRVATQSAAVSNPPLNSQPVHSMSPRITPRPVEFNEKPSARPGFVLFRPFVAFWRSLRGR